MTKLFKHPRAPFAIALAASLGLALGGVLMAELLRLAACPLCIIQRMLYLALAAVAALGLLVAHRPLASRLTAAAMALVAATGAGVAGYQVWIQRFAPMTTCSGQTTWWEDLVESAGELLPLLFKPSGLCSDPAWKFLSLSIADWSLGCFVVLLGVAVYGVVRRG